MTIDDIRYLAAYDRWATAKVLAAADGVDAVTWSAIDVVDERGLGGILVHQLGANQRWRNGLAGTGSRPRPEEEPLIDLPELRGRWEAEWAAWADWLEGLDDDWLASEHRDIPHWRLLAHVVNHGTQHRSEAAALLTAAGRSPGDLDMFDFAMEHAAR
jgi:uncharacterized damage-inducible protein DinB